MNENQTEDIATAVLQKRHVILDENGQIIDMQPPLERVFLRELYQQAASGVLDVVHDIPNT